MNKKNSSWNWQMIRQNTSWSVLILLYDELFSFPSNTIGKKDISFFSPRIAIFRNKLSRGCFDDCSNLNLKFRVNCKLLPICLLIIYTYLPLHLVHDSWALYWVNVFWKKKSHWYLLFTKFYLVEKENKSKTLEILSN